MAGFKGEEKASSPEMLLFDILAYSGWIQGTKIWIVSKFVLQ